MSFSLSEYTKIDVGWGFAPDPTGEFTASPGSASWFQGGRFAAGGKWRGGEGRARWREGREGLGERREQGKGGQRENMEEKGKGESWGNSALVVVGIDAPAGW